MSAMEQRPRSPVIPPQQQRSRRFLEKVMAAARETLVEQGATDFTMTVVAERAGVSISGIYRRFESREVLLRAVKDEVFIALEKRLIDALETADPTVDAIVRAFEEVLIDELSSTNQLYPSILSASPTDEVMANRGTTFLDRVFRAFSKSMSRIDAPFQHEDPELAVKFAFQVAVGVPLRRASVQGTPSIPSDVTWQQIREQTIAVTVGYLASEFRRS